MHYLQQYGSEMRRFNFWFKLFAFRVLVGGVGVTKMGKILRLEHDFNRLSQSDASMLTTTLSSIPNALTLSTPTCLSLLPCLTGPWSLLWWQSPFLKCLGVGWLLEFYTITNYMVILGWVQTWDSWWLYIAAPLGDQAAITMTWCPTQLPYPDVEPTSPCHILIISIARLGNDKYQFSSQWVRRLLNSFSHLVWSMS